jgi:Flp pilus assembly protein TadD
MSAVLSVVTFTAQKAVGTVVPLDVLPLSERLSNAVAAYVGYLSKAFWPVDLALIYPHPNQTSVAKTVLAILVMVGITIGVAVLSRKRLWLAVGWLWFLGTLVPVIGLVQVGAQSMADRYTYVPLIGVFIMIAWSLPPGSLTAINRRRVTAMAAVVALMLTALAAVTFTQIQLWKNATTIFDHALKVTAGNFVAYNGLGVTKVSLGRIDEAISIYRHALELNPNYVDALANLGSALLAQGKYDEAIEMCEKALRLRPNLAETHEDLGAALRDCGRADESIFHHRKALELNPDLVAARLNLAMTLLEKGNYDEAIAHLEYVLRLHPQHEGARQLLSAAKLERDAAATRH